MVAAIVIIIIIIVVGVAGYLVTLPKTTTTQTTTSSVSTTSIVSTSSSSLSTTSASTSTTTISSSSVATTATSSSATSTSSSSSTPQTLVIDDAYWSVFVGTMNDETSYVWPDWMAYTVEQPLVTVNPNDEFSNGTIHILPDLAQSWTVSANGSVYSFDLRRNVTFSNGDPFNAYQVWGDLYGHYYLCGNCSNWLDFGYSLFNFSNVQFGPQSLQILNQSGLVNPTPAGVAMMTNSSWPIYVQDPYTIVFRMTAPYLWLLNLMTGTTGLLWDAQYVLDHGGFGTPTALNNYLGTHPIPGTGPYMVTDVVQNNYVSFTQNSNYWGANLTAAQIQANPYLDPGHVKNVVVYYKPDDLSRYVDLSTGAAQISTIFSPDWNLVLANPNKYGYYSTQAPSAFVFAISLNTQDYPTNITDFRQAIVHAINYTDVIDTALLGQAQTAVPPQFPIYSQYYDLGNFTPYQYNLTLAQKYLNESGVNVNTLAPISFTVDTPCLACVTTAQVVQGDLSALGITVDVNEQSSSQYYTDYGSYSYNLQNAASLGQMSILSGESYALFLSPSDLWVTTVSNQSGYGNWAIYSNPVVQKAVDAYLTSDNVSYIQSVTIPAQAQIYNDAPYVYFIPKLWDAYGSIVYNKQIISGFYGDPTYSGMTTAPIFNTVTFTNST